MDPVAIPGTAGAPNVPNLFILGAAKSGTSSLHDILGQHPDIHASAVKEPTFFCDSFQITTNPIEYFNLFASDRPLRMEASHAYLTNPATAPVLRALFPEARFIVTLREPRRRAYSLYRHMRRTYLGGNPVEPLEDFADALRFEPVRCLDHSFVTNCPHYLWNYLYCLSSRFDLQLERYFALFPRSQFHVLTLAELAKSPVATTEGILEFLGVDTAPAQSFRYEPQNVGGEHPDYGADAEAIMAASFEGLTDRVDELVGRQLDWSL